MNGLSCRPESKATTTFLTALNGLVYDTAGMARRSLITSIQDGGNHFQFRLLNFGSRPTSDNVGSAIQLRRGRKWPSVPIGIMSLSHIVQELFPFSLPFGRRHLELRSPGNVGQCRQCHRRVRHDRKCGGSPWNRVANSMRSVVVSTSGFGGRHSKFGSRPTSSNVGQRRQCHIQFAPGRKCACSS